MSYTPTTWNTGDTITASAMNKIEQGIANAGGGGYDFVITGAWESDDWADLTLESGSYSDIVSMLQNGNVPSGVAYIDYDNAVRISALVLIKDMSATDNFVSCGFLMYVPWDNSVDVVFMLINSDGTVDPD